MSDPFDSKKPILVYETFVRMAMPWDDPKDVHLESCDMIVSKGRRRCDCKPGAR